MNSEKKGSNSVEFTYVTMQRLKSRLGSDISSGYMRSRLRRVPSLTSEGAVVGSA